jgi:two-component system, NtrC family, nitrogen regulation sensor histidine kinase NtrY
MVSDDRLIGSERGAVHFERRVLLLAMAVAVPGTLLALALLWMSDYSLGARITITLVTVLASLLIAVALRAYVIHPLRTVSNLAAALREGDFSVRARGESTSDALGLALLEFNRLGAILRAQRLTALDASALARTVMREINVAVFAFDDEDILRLVNRAGERLINLPSERAIGRSATALGLADCLVGDPERAFEGEFVPGENRWQLRRTTFRQGGRPHQLVVLADLSRALRDEERSAWQRLLRVLGHEINNSLAPIQSLSATLREHVRRTPRANDWEEDLDRGLEVIGGRSAALARFMASYTLLARMPAPARAPVDVAAWVDRIVHMETRVRIDVERGPQLVIDADADQLDQMLINLIRNAADASLETGGGVTVAWSVDESFVDISIRDEGFGLPETANLFVPFFTTKPGGSGIGLVLSRQIAEAHGGSLTLIDGDGCEARVRLPVAPLL